MCAMPRSPFALPCRRPASAPLIAALAGACAVMAGCAKTQDAAKSADAAEASESVITESVTIPEDRLPADEQEPSIVERPLGGVASTPAKPVPVKVGKTPLVYLADAAQVVQVVDETTGVIMAELPVRGRTIVRVDERNGVKVGDEQVFAGPLPEDRRYGIYVVPDSQNVSRSGLFTPRPTRTLPPPPPPAPREGATPEPEPDGQEQLSAPERD